MPVCNGWNTWHQNTNFFVTPISLSSALTNPSNQRTRKRTDPQSQCLHTDLRNTLSHGAACSDPQMEPNNLCTVERRGRVHVITLTGAGEHRLNPALLSAIRSAVAAVRASPGAGALVMAAEGKFFCNGYDLAWARAGPPNRIAVVRAALRGLVADLLALPMPTVAAVTGHAAGAGCGLALALALAHDATVMRASRGFLYMSEVDAGIKIIDYFGELIRQKVPDAVARRDLVLKGEKMTAAEAVRRGIVDSAVEGGVEDVVNAAFAEAEKLAARGWDGEVVAEIRKVAWPKLWSKVKDYGVAAPAAARPRL